MEIGCYSESENIVVHYKEMNLQQGKRGKHVDLKKHKTLKESI